MVDPLQKYDISGRVVQYEQGSFSRVTVYYKGWHPELCNGFGGRFVHGVTGQETAIEMTLVRPVKTFTVQ